ncbi:MAG: EI24 domain-containing protein [Pseudomonadota bacterium]|nr:MAG: hypothetical protein DIU74_05340 [Pseudomonadota bacterium]
MTEIVKALVRGLASTLHPRMILWMIWPLAVALLVWGIAAVAFGAQTVRWLEGQLSTSAVAQWISQWIPFEPVAAVLGWAALLILFVPLVIVTASFIVGVFGMTAMVDHVARNYYPGLERRHGGTIMGMAGNAVMALVVFLLLSLVTLPLWFIPVLWPVLPVLLLAYFNQRMFRYDALSEHADKDEMQAIFKRHNAAMYGLAILLSLIAQIPLVGFFIPVIAGLAFTHYGLAQLERMRRA